MVRSCLIAAIAIVALALGVAAADWEGVSFSAKHKTCQGERKRLTFVFDEMSFGDLARATGAFEETPGKRSERCTLTDTRNALLKLENVCTGSALVLPEVRIDGSNVKEVIEAARQPEGSHAIVIKGQLKDVSALQDTIILEAIREAEKASNGDVTISFAGKRPVASQLISERRDLQTSTQLLVRMAPDTFIGLVLLVSTHLLLIFFLCCCMDGIMVQNKYAKQYPLRGKELN